MLRGSLAFQTARYVSKRRLKREGLGLDFPTDDLLICLQVEAHSNGVSGHHNLTGIASFIEQLSLLHSGTCVHTTTGAQLTHSVQEGKKLFGGNWKFSAANLLIYV